MKNSLEELYQRMLPEAVKGKALLPQDADEHQLDCLLHPEKHPLVIRTGACACSPEKQKGCAAFPERRARASSLMIANAWAAINASTPARRRS